MVNALRQEYAALALLGSKDKECDEKDLSSAFSKSFSKPADLFELSALHARYLVPTFSDGINFFLKVNDIANKVIQNEISSCYSYDNEIVRICSKAKERGRAKCWHFNCYGFISHCIKITSVSSYYELIVQMNALKRTAKPSFDGIPCPYNLAVIFGQQSELKHWIHVQDVRKAKQGDIIVYLPIDYRPLEAIDVEERPTGTHALVVARNIGEIADGFFHFSVIDCTRKHHAITDSRFPDKNGIGRNSLFIFPESEGRCRLRWTSESGNEYKKKVVVGRMKNPICLKPAENLV